MPTLYAKKSYAGSQSAVDLSATSRWLYNRLLDKDLHEEEEFGARKASRDPSAVTPGVALVSGPTAAASSSTPPTARESVAGSTVGRVPSILGSNAGPAEGRGTILAAMSPVELERERDAFMRKHTTSSTRVDVQAWVEKVFNLTVKQSKEELEQSVSKSDRRRRARSSGGTSDSGASGFTLAAAGASMATTSHKAPSLISAESLVVHDGDGADVLSAPERLRAYLAQEIPELRQHVDKYVAAKCEEVQRRVDGEVADHFLKSTTKRCIFGPQSNYLRWQGTRRAKIDRVLEENMPRWIWEAVKSWDQHQALKDRDADVSDVDLVWDYLTKRAAHIDSGKLATEIPIFKPLMASYTLPPMWRDKYMA